MNIESLGLCRANRKIYEKLRITGLNGGSPKIVFDVSAETHLPCELYSLGTGEYVAVTPDAPLDFASYSIGNVDVNGTIAETATHAITFDSAKWQSRINYKLHKNLCEEIRCYDESHELHDDGSRLYLQQVNSCPNRLIFLMTLRLPGISGNKLNMVVLDDKLNVLTSDYVFMGGKTVPPIGPGADGQHEVNVSVNLPWGLGDVTVFAWEDSNSSLLIQRFIPQTEWQTNQQVRDAFLFNNAGVDPYYPEWLRLHRPSVYELEQQKEVRFNIEPKFSVIVPLYKTPVTLFEEMLSSLLAQTYWNWECILVNSTPSEVDLKQRVSKAADIDGRIRIVELDKNLGISLNTNAGINVATGDFICFFDHDDVIEPNLLYEYAKAINESPETDLLYCDEDKLLPNGTYAAPYFKCDFNLDLLRSNNYICHMLCVRRDVLAQIKPNTAEYDGAQDHNLTFRVIERTRNVCHVPKMLYHWRVTEQSTSASDDAKPYATLAGIKSLEEHLERVGVHAKVTQGDVPFSYKVKYDVPTDIPLVSIIIPTMDHVDLLKQCIESIEGLSTYPNYEIVVVENNSTLLETFDYYQSLEQDDKVTVKRWKETGFNFSKLINFGRKASRGEYLILLNNDTEVITPDWIEQMLGNCARPEVGVVGVKLYYPDDTTQHAGVVLAMDAGHSFLGLPRDNPGGYFRLANIQRNVSAVTGACMMIDTTTFDSIGGFDESFAVAYNDVDFCLRAQETGKLVVYLPDVELYHYESVSRGYDENGEARIRYLGEKARMIARWARVFAKGDPYYNPNLRQTLPDACFYRL